MSPTKLQAMSVDQLVQRFISIALAQDDALLRDEYAKFNQLFGQMENIEDELKARGGDQRRTLLRLYDHENAQVRLKAALATLAVVPELARSALQALADSKEYPQAGDAGMALWNLDRGVFKPT